MRSPVATLAWCPHCWPGVPLPLLCVQLSGGERSYTTVAFTLALGGHTEMPFRAMDEFDVVGGVAGWSVD
jgi:DNA repair ATPase RecN